MGNSPAMLPPGPYGANEAAFTDGTAEHISLGDEYQERECRQHSREISDKIEIKDRMRGRETLITIYEQGFARVIEKRRGKETSRNRLDLRFLDPMPSIERRYPMRLIKVTGGVAGVALIVSLLAAFDVLVAVTAPAAAVAVAAAFVCMIWSVYLSHEKICFHTMHGRAKAIQLSAGVGCIGRHRKAIPTLVGAIEEASDDIGEDTMVYLRAEMREHYRLRGDGVLSANECSDSTSRILSHFDEPV